MSHSASASENGRRPSRGDRRPGPNGTPGGEGGTADRLLRVAAELFRQQGYAATTTRQLSDRLGIQKASLYHHIRGKEDLLFQISMESLRRISEVVRDAADTATPVDRLRAMIIAHVLSVLRDQDLHTTMLVDLRSLSPARQTEVRQRRDEYEWFLVDAVRAEQEAGLLRDDYDAHNLTLALLNLLNWTIFWYNPGGKQSARQIAEMLATTFLDGARLRQA
jgi:AcrR family transcriptional regulator